jgi:hypothetical protein
MAWSQPHLTDPPMGPTDEIRKLQHRLLFAYPANSKAVACGVIESGIFDSATDQALRNIQAHLGGAVNSQPGVLTYDTKIALGVYVIPVPPKASRVYFSVCGTGVPWSVGYCFDLGAQLDPHVWYHQPIAYPAAAFPMKPSYTAGVTELIRQLELHNCETTPWAFGGYSQGAIVTSIVLQRVLTGDLQRFRGTLLGGVTFGNPMREAGHTLPGGIDNGGSGVVLPNLVGTPESVWDMADDKGMVNSPGNDFYTKVGIKGQSAQAVADERAVWDIVDNKKITTLALAIAKLMAEPSFTGTIGAAEAAFAALDFFVVQGISPHLAYGDIQPIAGDPRDSWRVALDHLNSLST